MTESLKQTLRSAETLPDEAQERLASVMRNLILEETLRQSRAEIEAGQGIPANQVFSEAKEKLKAKHGVV